MPRLYREDQINMKSWGASTVLYDVKQQRDKQIFREQDRDIRQALYARSATDYLKDDNENAV